MQLKTKVPFFSLQEQSTALKAEVLSAIEKVIEQSDYVLGKDLVQFEKSFASYCESAYALAVSNGTAAIYVALRALNIKEGDEVILPSATFSATALAICQLGATPVFCDIDARTWTIDPADIEKKISNKTKAIIAVHLYGNPCRMDALLELAEKYKIELIEDAAQAHGSSFNKQKVGSFGSMACFSFYPSKNLGSMGDAGAVVYNNPNYTEFLAAIRNCGKNFKGEHEFLGFNYRMTSFQAAVLNVKLPHLDSWNKRRQEIASFYKNNINNPKIEWQESHDSAVSVYHLFVVKADSREKLMAYLEEEGIGYSLHYKEAVHQQAAYKDLVLSTASLPITEDLFSRCVSLPLFPEMTLEQCQRVVEVINAY
ncbi:MAG: DegT/DnrJ/EryC1/StrS family aminotransferase [Chitinophagales bacterium]|nr:DegT/DnrJ/EryC1/StrS family aminotransferase [Bacteroidota bacterium]MCB9256443.1 DegT/DnrJ/EryC1/StrS family aminotransferase [Chitinophagales bacterium]